MSEKTFDVSQIDDIRIILKAGDKHYALIPKQDLDKEKVKLVRIKLAETLLNFHDVVMPALEDIKSGNNEEGDCQ